MPIHRNDPCPCASGLVHKFCCRNKPRTAPGVANLADAVNTANDRHLPRRTRRALCRDIAKRLYGCTASQVFQPKVLHQGYTAVAAQVAHHKRKAHLA